jgi:MFS family permease
MVGALSGGVFAKFGKWNMIMVANVFAAVGYAFCIYAQLWAVIVGRVSLGIAIGFYCCFCPKFVNEITPQEYRGPVGSLA